MPRPQKEQLLRFPDLRQPLLWSEPLYGGLGLCCLAVPGTRPPFLSFKARGCLPPSFRPSGSTKTQLAFPGQRAAVPSSTVHKSLTTLVMSFGDRLPHSHFSFPFLACSVSWLSSVGSSQSTLTSGLYFCISGSKCFLCNGLDQRWVGAKHS